MSGRLGLNENGRHQFSFAAYGAQVVTGNGREHRHGLVAGLLVGVLLFLEGQGYVLAMLAAVVQGRSFLWPANAGAPNRKQGYLIGLKQTASLYLLVILVLAVVAVYEAILAIVILPE